ncbi:adenosylcobinamide-GDP ribazoletransferase [Marinospirillum alkaliphilum]|uniref:Adenosylcobinamide-GDP ribazoletransferase n=1 Tax=Marinospirillum alkaliphilum DSM 21637 TaxID=1122209 RepID=A0A1K1XJC4_9GAMM|nr:adenosylcobinamide-GDP ribazoletransferase [Marinospirillum alkaliphilum]SFX49703.1 cobalamin-5'-phosphate synthase [Marinospirillum alkaliphilum DSM 21637]
MKYIQRLRHELKLLLVAIQFLTRLPVPALPDYQPQWLHQSARWFPFTGLLVGSLTAGVFALLFWLFNPWVAAIGSTAFSIRLTGAFHEDGLADTCDGLGGGFTRERALEIMKDSRLGTYGTLGLVLALALKVALLASLPLLWAVVALVLAHGFSRWFSILLIHRLDYAGDLDHAKAKPLAQHLSLQQALFALATLSPALLLSHLLLPDTQWYGWLLPLLLMLLTGWYMARLLHRRLGGYTGDGLGATQQLTELAAYAGLVLLCP